ncbi:MAG: T9SS type A sorting domain-containing protein [Paludibacter sp.]|nr:T9SS type A sorting domain-containing protein [Paludibacter sp.]
MKYYLNYLKAITILLAIFLFALQIKAQNVTLLADEFNIIDANYWKGINLQGTASGTFVVSNSSLIVTSPISTQSGAYNITPVSGNFYTETEFETDDAVGLALIKNNAGVPDLNNYTMLAVTNRSNKVYINQYDCQNGVSNIHDPYKTIPSSRYQAVLDGSIFSVPYTGTNKKIRILHESLSNTFHFYYGTTLTKLGITSNDWLELAPQYSWLSSTQQYFVALVCRNENSTSSKQVKFNYIKAIQTPVSDIDNTNTGFKAIKREYNWSGFNGNAVVVSFGSDFAFSKEIKFIFWDRANNAPMWRINNQYMMNWEFGERKNGGYDGCAEAMSDRQRHGQILEILEDNNVRKVIHWRGYYLFPNYNYPGEGYGGTQLPYYEEIWTFYPDGIGTRRFLDVPNLDSNKSGVWPEFIEGIPIGGTLVNAGDLCNSPALTISNLTGNADNYFPNTTFNSASFSWDQIIFSSHFKGGNPDLFLVYNQSNDVPGTWAGFKPLEGGVSWHSPTLNFSHWPVGREPYGQNTTDVTIKSMGMMKNEVTSASLVSAGFYSNAQDWSYNYKVNSEGRKYREYVMLSGAASASDTTTINNNVQTWLYPGTITMLNSNSTFTMNNFSQRELVFNNGSTNSTCDFIITPKKRKLINPALRIDNWNGSDSVIVKMNGVPIYHKAAKIEGSLLVWIKASFNVSTKFEVSNITTGLNNNAIIDNFNLALYPNPCTVDNINISINIHSADNITLQVFDINGRIIEILENGYIQQGEYKYKLKQKLNTGVYIVRITSSISTRTLKLILN